MNDPKKDSPEKIAAAKQCFYDGFIKYNSNEELIAKNCNYADAKLILKIAKYYLDNHASEEEKKLYSRKQVQVNYYRNDTKYQMHVDNINKLNTITEVEEYINENNIQRPQLVSYLNTRMSVLGDKDGSYSTCLAKLSELTQFINKRKQKNNKIKSRLTEKENIYLARVTLQDYINSDYVNKQDYCRSKGLSISVFDKRLSLLKRVDPKAVEEIKNKEKAKLDAYHDSLLPIAKEILDKIENDPDYNIINYYVDHGVIPFKDITSTCSEYGLDIRAIKTFFNTADTKSNLTLKAFKEQNYIINDHLYTEEEKEKLYNFAREYHIPRNGENMRLIIEKEAKGMDLTIQSSSLLDDIDIDEWLENADISWDELFSED